MGAARVAALTLSLLATAGSTACNYSFRAGSFPPPHIRTVAVLPFENETTRFELTQELHQALLRSVPRSLGLNSAAEDAADAVVRGVIRRYALETPLYRPEAGGRAEVTQREVTLAVEVQIVDRRENVILWEDRGVQARGQFLEASQTEDIGRARAIELVVQRIVDGAQSNW